MHIDIILDGERPKQIAIPSEIRSKSSLFALDRARKGGGNGVVFSAKEYINGSLIRTCAVKFLRKLDTARKDRFLNEIRVLQSLNHHNISEYYGNGLISIEKHKVPWIAQELGGRNLREHVQNRGPIPGKELILIAQQMCAAAQHVSEKNYIHRDIKPDNFVWVENSKSEILMIDFGIAKQMNEDVSGRPMDTFTRNLEFVGPVFYSSPELISYAHDKSTKVDTRSDVFQLAKSIWFLATGNISAGVPARKLCPFKGALCDLIIAAVDDDPDMRPSSPLALSNELKKLL